MDNINSLVERLRGSAQTWNDMKVMGEAADLIEQQAERIAELEAARIAYASEFPADAEVLPDVGNVHANIRLLKKRIADLEAITTIPDYAMPPGDQEWAKVDPAVAFHLIERHAENWAHAGQLMEAWADARLGAQAGEPVGEVGSMPGTDGFTMACFKASEVPVGTKIYAAPVDSAMAKLFERLMMCGVIDIGEAYLELNVVGYPPTLEQFIAASEPKKTGE